jgi:Flp pilus assembly protein CpaB
MTIHITSKTKRQDLVNAARKLKQGKKLDAKKVCGTVKWREDGLAAQKRMRDEWN